MSIFHVVVHRYNLPTANSMRKATIATVTSKEEKLTRALEARMMVKKHRIAFLYCAMRKFMLSQVFASLTQRKQHFLMQIMRVKIYEFF